MEVNVLSNLIYTRQQNETKPANTGVSLPTNYSEAVSAAVTAYLQRHKIRRNRKDPDHQDRQRETDGDQNRQETWRKSMGWAP